ncbi:hypothetical protein INR49_027469 [Caranx melampygus]|nr:hypothetical protein INR49_027469 [Caranx melampygus]
MAEHHAASDGRHKASTNAGGSVHGNSRPGAAGGGGGKGGLSGGLTQPAGWQSLLSFSILFLACLAGFSSRLFAVIRFESIIHEFDPWSQHAALWASAPAYRAEKKGGVRETVFPALLQQWPLQYTPRIAVSDTLVLALNLQRFNYRSTHHLTTNGFYEFLNWFDERAWYPLGRIVGGTLAVWESDQETSTHLTMETVEIPPPGKRPEAEPEHAEGITHALGSFGETWLGTGSLEFFDSSDSGC